MPRPTLHRSPCGTAPGGEDVDLLRLDSGTGVRAEVLTYGGILHSLSVPDATGDTSSVVLSLASVDQYAEKSPYFGAFIGRYANRTTPTTPPLYCVLTRSGTAAPSTAFRI